jgi:toxin CptA
MSIAVSAVVRSSMLLRRMTLAMALMSMGVGLAMLSGLLGAIQEPVRWMVAAPCIVGGICAMWKISRKNPAVRIDISGIGQIRIEAEARQNGALPRTPNIFDASQTVMRLLPSSTLWSHLMILRLQAEQGLVHTILILPDTTSPTSFRALSVACHWIAAQNNRAESDKT